MATGKTIYKFWITALATLGCATVLNTAAQDFPSRPITIIVPVAAGGGTDTLARTLGLRVQESLKQTVLVENRLGAGGNIGAEAVARSKPDGHTLLVTPATIATNVAVYKKLPYDLMKDFQAVTLTGETGVVLVVHPSLPANNLQEFIALAKSKPGELNFGTAGNGSPQHLHSERFNQFAGIKTNAIPYKGQSQAMNDLVGGQLHYMFSPIQNALPFIQQGRVRALVVGSGQRHRNLPQVPSLAESGFKNVEMTNWFVLLAPAGTPMPIINKLNAEFVKAGNELRAKLEGQGFDHLYSTPQEAMDFMRNEQAVWTKVAASAGIVAE
jgi:tripartite-type tricarboxylate transporter receptor subunit TctC